MSKLKKAREDAGQTLERAAVAAGVTSPTVRLFEAGGPDAIKTERKRAALVALYAKYSERTEALLMKAAR